MDNLQIIKKELQKYTMINNFKETDKFIIINTNIPINFRNPNTEVSFKQKDKNYISFKLKKQNWSLTISKIQWVFPKKSFKFELKHKYSIYFRYYNYKDTLEYAIEKIDDFLKEYILNMQDYI
jgi:hypothetical protein